MFLSFFTLLLFRPLSQYSSEAVSHGLSDVQSKNGPNSTENHLQSPKRGKSANESSCPSSVPRPSLHPVLSKTPTMPCSPIHPSSFSTHCAASKPGLQTDKQREKEGEREREREGRKLVGEAAFLSPLFFLNSIPQNWRMSFLHSPPSL